MNKDIKIFLSYSHKNSNYLETFEKHIFPIIEKYCLDIYRDTKNLAGEEFWKNIITNLDNSDIVCLFISPDYLISKNCIFEANKAIELQKEKSIKIIPIILTPCFWLDCTAIEGLPKKLAIPTDGKAVSSFSNQDDAWIDIIQNLKPHFSKIQNLKNISLSGEISNFINSSEEFKKSHSKKEILSLNDIFISPKLEIHNDNEDVEEIDFDEIDYNNYKKIIISGESRSGKTTLCKYIFKKLFNMGKLPIYIKNTEMDSPKLRKILEKRANIQYIKNDIAYSDIKKNVVPILDDFYKLDIKRQNKYIKELQEYDYSIVIFDDSYNLNIEEQTDKLEYNHFNIAELGPLKRAEIIHKWNSLSDDLSTNESYKKNDLAEAEVTASLGKIIGKGIIPSYPFYILSILRNGESLEIINENVTSQGHFYQTLIFLSLSKYTKSDNIDVYINFLSELSCFLFKKNKKRINTVEYNEFIETYTAEYNLPIDNKIIENCLKNAQILEFISLGISFKYDYMYYYFIGKYFADNADENKKNIYHIFKNLHKNENAYISIFIFHHSKNTSLLREIENLSKELFKDFTPLTLRKNETEEFDKEINYIIEAKLPDKNNSPQANRHKKLQIQEEIEKKENNSIEENDDKSHLQTEIRRSIKTAEVIGNILKNRAGSLKKTEIKSILLSGISIHLRLVKSYFDFVNNEEKQESVISFIEHKIDLMKEELNIDIEDKKELAKKLFWNINFMMIIGAIKKITHSLASENLKPAIIDVCNELDSPISFIIKQEVFMSYSKNIDIDTIIHEFNKKDFSLAAQKAMKHLIIDYCLFHDIKYKERAEIDSKLGISSKKILEKRFYKK
ncbi:TIR domain-containing protein [Francisella philomiragia]|uniref:TIR domain-containing protein n=1 Tax=Francisella philomiragia TaxID=28110 RepID=UPI0019075E32|nr:toll/interleukin-1 receptor domain-containing protein [Francisella philomiragia]MBK2266559.1 toll/interleukin-1 receptor domain-containing protein [Francisella philomiragia]MBK2278273.1 toll/interleukin-1 receptor domain-containing protein [Francisella philomiragia]MBK2286129.1 toll/interleukin-1 receptor domain-containing protein [Francisella philomiragia]MBK2287842.1 toll/interleukin-1 receptor domain-containing protein [Francisella philomiragia]MBK2290088.1 toll/interleukin-1 receptor do